MPVLHYIHDPMCSWCWGFKPVWTKLQEQLPKNITINYLLGGLAKDSNLPMPLTLQTAIQNTWHTIEDEIPGVKFNFDFWTQNLPRRSTYPACRAIIAARNQQKNLHSEMTLKIQQAYYLQALNPSDINVLIHCAAALKLDVNKFRQDMSSTLTQKILDQEIELSRELGAQGFPSLVLSHKGTDYFIEIDYKHTNSMIDTIQQILNSTN